MVHYRQSLRLDTSAVALSFSAAFKNVESPNISVPPIVIRRAYSLTARQQERPATARLDIRGALSGEVTTASRLLVELQDVIQSAHSSIVSFSGVK